MSKPSITPVTTRRRLTGIKPEMFEHPLDLEAMNYLKSLPGFDLVTAKFLELGSERILYFVNTASNIRVGPRQLPRIYAILRECCDVLDVLEPELYVAQGSPNAYTFGHTHPYIVLYSEILDLMDDDELLGVIAHELGHIKCGHVLYRTMARFVGQLAIILGEYTFHIGNVILWPIETGLFTWEQRSELSADRAALLALQDVHPMITMLMKQAGGTTRFGGELNAEEFLNQAKAYSGEKQQPLSSKAYRVLASLYKGSHPFTVERAQEIDQWAHSQEYAEILQTDFQKVVCPQCNAPVLPEYRFCTKCGTRLG